MKPILMSLVLLLCMGCGAPAEKTATGEAAADAGAPAGDAAAGGYDIPFKDMAFSERKDFMKDVVMPEMKPLFIEHHPDFACVTCHGDNMAEVNYEMPNTVAPLNPAAMPFESEDENMRAAAVYMKDTITPTMARLLKEEPWNPETKAGFGCFDCHATAAP